MQIKTKLRCKRFLCLLLALIILVSVPLQLHAKALAIESAWVIYAIITYLAAVGITFTAVGGIEALQAQVQDKTDTYYEVTGIDLVELLKQTLKLKTGGTGGNGGGFWFGFTAAALMADFIDWLFDNGWSKGKEISVESKTSQYNYLYNGDSVVGTTSVVELEAGSNSGIISKTGTIHPMNKNISSGNVFYQTEIIQNNGNTAIFYWNYTKSNGFGTNRLEYYYNYSLGIGKYTLTYKSQNQVFGSTGYNANDIVGLTLYNANGNEAWGLVTSDNYCLYVCPVKDIFSSTVTEEATITVPSELLEVTPAENEGVLIDTGIDISTLDSPEQLAEIIKKKFEDDGTITKPQTIIQTDETVNPSPSPQTSPSPAPTPVVEDIEDLGLPQLGEALQNKFPFCLPDDLRDLFSILAAEPQTPKWEFDLFATLGNRVPFVGDTSISIDLGEYEEIGVICRWASVISFCIFLILTTKGMIGW